MQGKGKIREISREVNYIAEGIALLQHLGVGERYEDLKESLGKKYAKPFREGLRKFEILERIEKNALKVFRKDMEEVRYYFSVKGEGGLNCAGKLVLLWEDSMLGTVYDAAGLRRFLAGLSEKEYCTKFGKCLHSFVNMVLDDGKIMKTEEPFAVISCLMKLEMEESEKWKLQKIFFDRKEHEGKVLLLLEKAVAVLESFREELEELTGIFSHYWAEELKGDSPAAYMREMAEIDLGESPYGFFLYPSIVSPNIISWHAEMEDYGEYKEPDLFRIGILFGEDFDIKTSRARNDEEFGNYALQAMKLLGDRSKFEILSCIRDGEAYGSKLAKHLNLTTATVSYHMNALVAAGLVEIKRVHNRVYYRTNKTALKEVLDYIRKSLTGE